MGPLCVRSGCGKLLRRPTRVTGLCFRLFLFTVVEDTAFPILLWNILLKSDKNFLLVDLSMHINDRGTKSPPVVCLTQYQLV